MPHILHTLKRSTFVAIITLSLATAPVGVTFADDQCNPPDQSQSGVHWPTGSDATMFTYQCSGAYAGQWTSTHYVFDPADNSRTPLDAIVYNYNTATDMFDAKIWDYNAAKGAYQLDTISVTNPPSGATVHGSRPAPVKTTNPTPADNNTNNVLSAANNTTHQSPTSGSTAGSGPGSTNDINFTGNNNVDIGNNSAVNMRNGLISFASTGDANVSSNTTGGSASTGNAKAIANIINSLQSSSNVLSSPNITTFTADINGDVNGDLLLDPSKLGAVQPANVSTSLDNNVKINNSLDANIINDISLGSQTGNANVNSNSQGGDATTGNADAVANIVNVLNSYVTAGQSFVGVVNINGNLNGDILLPPGFIDTLLASNVPHYNITTNLSNQNTVTDVNNATVNNNVQLASQSGKANVSGNTSAGSASTGDALTNLTVFNLTGSELVASNDMLVFVNVLGQWYGMIMNAPAGTTAASLGGGVTANNSLNSNTSLTNTNNQNITNNIKLKAKTGDANVTNNTTAGNAKSGTATTSASIANLINDRLTLNGWFGLLFINVFGTWHGSFGLNTAAGDPTSPPQTSGNSADAPMFAFTPTTTSPATPNQNNANSTSNPQATTTAVQGPQQASVLAAATHKAATDLPQLAKGGSANYALPLLGVALALILVAMGERGRLARRS